MDGVSETKFSFLSKVLVLEYFFFGFVIPILFLTRWFLMLCLRFFGSGAKLCLSFVFIFAQCKYISGFWFYTHQTILIVIKKMKIGVLFFRLVGCCFFRQLVRTLFLAIDFFNSQYI